jgi:hypothetical protein
MGFGMEYIAGSQKFAFDRDLSEEANDYDVLAQTIFDELNCDFIPDYYDPFGLEAPGETTLNLYGFNCQRAPVHGLVQLQQLGQTVFVQDAGLVNRGSSVTDVNGRYQTATPFMQAQTVNDVFCGIATTTTTAITAKRNRIAFYFPAIPTTSTIKSADISGFYQHLIGTVNSNIVNLIFTTTPDFSVFDYISTNINDANNVAVRWQPLTNQNEIILAVENSAGSILRYACNDLKNGVCTLSLTLGTGTTPALAINNQSLEMYFFRTSDSGGSIKRVAVDNTGTVCIASSIVITGNVTNDGLAAYWYDDICYLVYNHATNGITVVKSEDNGFTFS